MPLALVRRSFPILLVLTVLCWPALALAAAKETPQLPRVLLHVNGQEGLQDAALGLSMMLAASLDANQVAASISHFEIMKSAQKAKLLRKGNQILARDLAFLALSTQAQKAVLGYLERGESGYVLRLNAYNAEKGSPLYAVTIKETPQGTEELFDSALDALANILGLPKEFAWPKAETSFDWAQLKLLGQGMTAIDNGDVLNGLVLVALSKTRNPIAVEQARQALKQGAIPTEPPRPLGAPERAVLSQLASEPVAAMRAYEAQLRTPAAKALAPAYAVLLLGQKQAAKAQERNHVRHQM